jgi:hypothetical protein
MPNIINIPQGHTQIKTYLIRPDQEQEFMKFLGSDIRNFLEAHEVKNVNFYTSKQNGVFMLVATLDKDNTDWNEITGFSTFLMNNGLVDFSPHPALGLPRNDM